MHVNYYEKTMAHIKSCKKCFISLFNSGLRLPMNHIHFPNKLTGMMFQIFFLVGNVEEELLHETTIFSVSFEKLSSLGLHNS